MMNFLHAGGAGIWFVLALSITLLIASGYFALRATPRRLALIRGLTTATVFATLAGLAINLMAVMRKVPNNDEWAHSPDMPLIVMTGLGEALTSGVLGFAFLAVSWVFVAVGLRRLHAEDADES